MAVLALGAAACGEIAEPRLGGSAQAVLSDHDGDGIPDDSDLDDDNDGSRDSVECPAPAPPTLAAKELWVLFNPNIGASGRREIHVVGPPGTQVTIGSYPRRTIPASGFDMLDIGLLTVPSPGLIESGKAIPISATAPVQVFANNVAPQSVDAFAVVPVTLLGTEYYAIGYPNVNVLPQESQISVYAIEDNTSVTIGTEAPIVLDRGESFLRQRPGAVTDTRITSDKPIGVNAGVLCLSTGTATCDHVEEMLFPVTSWASNFYIPLLPQSQEYRVIVGASATRVWVDGVLKTTLNAGQSFSGSDGGVHVETSNPAEVYVIARGEMNGDGDPSFLVVPGVENGVTAATFGALTPAYANTVMVSMPTASVGTLMLDGAQVTASWRPYPTGGFSFAPISIPADSRSHTLTASDAFIPIVWGERAGESYGYVGGYAAPPAPCAVDSDGDGIVDSLDLDSDGDGIFDVDETGGVDLDRDGRADGGSGARGMPASANGGLAPLDTDGDGTPDRLDHDSDEDGLSDPVEAGDRDPATLPVDTDGDGTPDFQDPDSDNDQRVDGTDNCRLIANPDQLDSDGDGEGDVCDGDDNNDGFPDAYGVTGGGCATGSGATGLGGLLWIAAALIASRRRRAARLVGLSVALAAGAAGTASAQAVQEPQDFPAERLRLGADRTAILDVETGAVPAPNSWDLGMWLGVTNDPLTVYMDDGSGAQRVGSLVGNRIGGELMGAYTPLPWLRLGAAVPLILSQSRDNTVAGMVGALPSLQSYGVGDLRLSPKVRLLRGAVDLALIPELTLPTGRGEAYLGERTVSFVPTLAASRRLGRVMLAADLGWRMREQARVANTIIDDELFARVGVGLRATRSVELAGSFGVATAAAAPLGDRRNQIELIGGPSLHLRSGLMLFAAAGAGANVGYTTPDWRGLVGIRLGKVRDPAEDVAEDPDPDHDRILGRADRCPLEAEDFDGFQDLDGCPDLDDDGDRIADIVDGCPKAPETVNGFEDSDGCPDTLPDPDGDGIIGDADHCPYHAEDFDGFEDVDGCPDDDNDGDRIPDTMDSCPDYAEDFDGFEDVNGCPDDDNDDDGSVDWLDYCPDQAGPPENHGCPRTPGPMITPTHILIDEVVYFATDKAVIQARSYRLLNAVARLLAAHPELQLVQIEGHTDDVADDAYNLDLSQRRADAVRAYLIRKGIEPGRLSAAGFGETQPLMPNTSRDYRSVNRRVEFRILQRAAVQRTDW